MMHSKAKQIIRSLVAVLTVAWAFPVLAQQSLFLRDYPESYIVQDGDSLTDIARQFLQDPSRWQDAWMPDRYIDNPDTIYPGDTLRVEMISGQPRIVMQRGNRPESRLSPQIREIQLISSIPAIRIEDINASFTTNRIVPEAVYATAPYIVSTPGNNLIIGTGDEVYARGNWPAGVNSLEIYRQINSYEDPDTEESMGVELTTLGFATVLDETPDGVRRLVINNSFAEILIGDRLLVREEAQLTPDIVPTEPAGNVNGRVIAMANGERLASLLDTVIIDIGQRDNLVVGDVLSIQQAGERIVDSEGRSRKDLSGQLADIIGRERLQLPNKEVGTLLVYRTFEKLSYGVILTIKEPVGTGDFVTNP